MRRLQAARDQGVVRGLLPVQQRRDLRLLRGQPDGGTQQRGGAVDRDHRGHGAGHHDRRANQADRVLHVRGAVLHDVRGRGQRRGHRGTIQVPPGVREEGHADGGPDGAALRRAGHIGPRDGAGLPGEVAARLGPNQRGLHGAGAGGLWLHRGGRDSVREGPPGKAGGGGRAGVLQARRILAVHGHQKREGRPGEAVGVRAGTVEMLGRLGGKRNV